MEHSLPKTGRQNASRGWPLKGRPGRKVSALRFTLPKPPRCNSNHHSFGFIALPQRGRQHAAFDFQERSEFSEAIIQLGDAGFRRLDGPGRHGPGNMLFAYFEDPEKNLLEFCTEIQQVDEATHRPKAWDVDSALDTWRSPKGMGPPKGFRWVLPFAGQISKLSRKLLHG
jgi:Glyoxalase/Bleomycin resistance protein/Dioxygenase superfamily